MSNILRKHVRLAATAGSLLIGLGLAPGLDQAVSAADAPAMDTAALGTPDATFTIYSEENTAPGTFSGNGVLKYKGEERHFKIAGMNIQGARTNHNVDGAMYNLKAADDAAGHYTLVKHGTEAGMDVMELRNEKGLEAVARGTNKGMLLGIKASGVDVTMEK